MHKSNHRLDFNDFISASLDTNQAAATNPSKLIVICTVPRTAGNTLCRHMAICGWGIPSEYFLPDIAISLLSRWSGQHVQTMKEVLQRKAEYGNYLLAKRSNNGIFSLKLFPHQWQQFNDALQSRTSAMDHHCVLLQRRDLVEQTISILATMLTRRPSFSNLELPSLTKIRQVDERLVRSTFDWLLEKANEWPGLITNFGGSLHHIESENLIENPAGTLLALANSIGLPFDQASICQSIEFERNGTYQTNIRVKSELRSRFSPLLEQLLSAQRKS